MSALEEKGDSPFDERVDDIERPLTPPQSDAELEIDTPISGTTGGTTTSVRLPPFFPGSAAYSQQQQPQMQTVQLRSRSRGDLSVTSSMYSIASGMIPIQDPDEDLEGLVVQTMEQETENVRPAPPPTLNSPSSSSEALQALMADLKLHMDKTLVGIRDQSRRDFEKVLSVLAQESAKRTALEGKLHSQLLLQSENMVAMELKLLRLEAKVERREAAQRQQRSQRAPAFRTIDEEFGQIRDGGDRLPPPPPRTNGTEPTNIAVITSGGASLASGVTATSFLGDGDEGTADGDVEDEGDADDVHIDGSDSTPTQTSRNNNPIGGRLESILQNPALGEISEHGASTRATRGDADGNSSLATSVTNVTNSTLTSTVVTATTRGESVNVRSGRIITDVIVEDGSDPRQPRSRSQSPLTVQSSATGASQAEQPPDTSASVGTGTSILSNVAVAPPRSFGSRRAYAAALNAGGESRPLANRVVSFTTDILQAPPPAGMYSEGGDSITMPDELADGDLSEGVVDTFASSARLWREEYEARLDALQKRWGAE